MQQEKKTGTGKKKPSYVPIIMTVDIMLTHLANITMCLQQMQYKCKGKQYKKQGLVG